MMRFALIVTLSIYLVLAAEASAQKPVSNPRNAVPNSTASQTLLAADKPVEKLSEPASHVGPTDIISIEMGKMIPRLPYNIGIYDVLQIQCEGALPEQPIDNYYLVESDGKVNLGPTYGKAPVAGMSIDQAAQVITGKLQESLANPKVLAKIARTASMPSVTGQYSIGNDGSINLRTYGTLHVSGKTTPEIKQALQQHLAKYFDSPEVSVDTLDDIRKVVNVFNEKSKNIRRVLVGKDGLLAVIEAEGGFSNLSTEDEVWIAQPILNGSGECTIAHVDLKAIIKDKSTAKKYQLMPEACIFLLSDNSSEKEKITADTIQTKYERWKSSLLNQKGMGWIRGYQTLGRSYNQKREGF